MNALAVSLHVVRDVRSSISYRSFSDSTPTSNRAVAPPCLNFDDAPASDVIRGLFKALNPSIAGCTLTRHSNANVKVHEGVRSRRNADPL